MLLAEKIYGKLKKNEKKEFTLEEIENLLNKIKKELSYYTDASIIDTPKIKRDKKAIDYQRRKLALIQKQKG